MRIGQLRVDVAMGDFKRKPVERSLHCYSSHEPRKRSQRKCQIAEVVGPAGTSKHLVVAYRTLGELGLRLKQRETDVLWQRREPSIPTVVLAP